jgi:hypothetical protein
MNSSSVFEIEGGEGSPKQGASSVCDFQMQTDLIGRSLALRDILEPSSAFEEQVRLNTPRP